MDTVTYPDKTVREVAKSFVCIRVEYNAHPELVEQWKVKGLPDLRLLDGEGKEIAKLLGFTSPAKLAAQCQAALGKGLASGSEASGIRVVDPTPENVSAALKRGLAYLQASSEKGPGTDDLVLFATGERTGPRLERILNTPLTGTYQAAFRALALSRDPKAHHDALAACAAFLTRTQLANGQWTYGPAAEGKAVPALGDNSNTAYGVLGLAASRKAGIDVPKEAFEKAEAWWRKSQNPDGGWGYRSDRETESYASMTESGISSLLLCGKLLGKPLEKDPAVQKALAWLEAHFSVSENRQSAYQQGRLLYHLYALERLGSLSGEGKLCGHDWYREGAAFLLGTQKADGSWDDGADMPVPNTGFALLFLSRATQPLR